MPPRRTAQEAAIRKNLAERLPQMGKIDEVSKTPMSGLFEVRVGTELFYTDADGNFLIQGHLIDTKQQRNLTEERMDKLLAIDFSALPVKDAFTIVRGNGKRKIAVFEDPNCGYCKRFERDLQKVDNVTVYMFLYPILGPDSTDKSRNIWCAKDKGEGLAGLDGARPGRAAAPAATPAPWRATSSSARSTRSPARPRWCSPTEAAFPARSRAPQVEKMLADAKQ